MDSVISAIVVILTKGYSAFTRYGGCVLIEQQRVSVALRGARITVCFSTLASIIILTRLKLLTPMCEPMCEH